MNPEWRLYNDFHIKRAFGITIPIRFHCATLGHPVLGDERFDGREGEIPGRLYLHAEKLAFAPHSIFPRRPVFEAPFPDLFRRLAPSFFNPLTGGRA